MRHIRRFPVRSMALAAGLALAACVPGGPAGPEEEVTTSGPDVPAPAPPLPASGSITVGVSTGGVETPDSVSVSLDDQTAERLPSSGSFTWPDLAPGDYLVQVTDLPDNCAPDGANPRFVSLVSGGSEVELFTITCASTRAELRVRVSTTGGSRDEDGYRVELKGADVSVRREVDDEADLRFVDLDPGGYEVKLRDVDKKCVVEPDDEVDVELDTGARAEVEFRVTCAD